MPDIVYVRVMMIFGAFLFRKKLCHDYTKLAFSQERNM
jgi:hypothetical protein